MDEIIKHPGHQHELSLSERKYPFICSGCSREHCDGGVMIYSCRESDCGFSLHESCANLPQELHNPLLHPHPLSLLVHQELWSHCYVCAKPFRSFAFSCDKCESIVVDVKCAFIRLAKEERDHPVPTLHFSHHEHPFLVFENIPAHHIRCRVCGAYCSDPKTYGCLPCGFFLHPSCFNLPEEILHPFHPYHPLTRKPIKKPKRITKDDDDDADVKCNACRRHIWGIQYFGCFAYFCEYCNNTKTSFCLDAECASVIMPAITYEGHDHLLLFLDIDKKLWSITIYHSTQIPHSSPYPYNLSH
ncbi:protein VACUOLELESS GAMETOPHYTES-like [Corylus avellana]|uniref:protein VACUOLELESS GAMETOPHYTES-like n=1 Tax=Corylus avellana TaxID=13451 RepID=UPI00286D5A14|nr:protein VACUOLELESS GAMETOPHYTES-like [Corylus avellana]